MTSSSQIEAALQETRHLVTSVSHQEHQQLVEFEAELQAAYEDDLICKVSVTPKRTLPGLLGAKPRIKPSLVKKLSEKNYRHSTSPPLPVALTSPFPLILTSGMDCLTVSSETLPS